jgi:hypothetical protein
MEITIYFTINGKPMVAPFIVTPEASSNIVGMNVIRRYKLKMDLTWDNLAHQETYVVLLTWALPSCETATGWYTMWDARVAVSDFGDRQMMTPN